MKITNAQILKNMQRFVDKEVIVMKGQHANKKGRTVKAYIPNGKSRPVMLVEFDKGGSTEIENATWLFFITQKIPIDQIKNN